MKKKFMMCILLVLVLVLNTTVFALNASDHIDVHESCCSFDIAVSTQQSIPLDAEVMTQDGRILTLGEYIEELNAMYTSSEYAHNRISHAYLDNSMTTNSIPNPNPFTNCTNFFGHSWSSWSSWVQIGSIMHGALCGSGAFDCGINMQRNRSCLRHNCSAQQAETTWTRLRC